MSVIFTFLYFMLALLLLIIVHEYGHFLVARLCGVKVLRFSFGFGKVLASWCDKRGTQYAISLVPLGGYVKMLDETEETVSGKEKHLAFNNKPLWARIAIIVAGPLFNFLFAFVALWLVLVIGIKSLAPMIAEVKPGSIAARAGLAPQQEVVTLNDKKIASWRDFQYAFMPLLGTQDAAVLQVKSLRDESKHPITLNLENWQLDVKNPDLLASLGIVPFIPTIPPIVGEVIDVSPAEKAGLQRGDRIISLNGEPITDWFFLVEFVRQHPNQSIKLGIKRNHTTLNLDVNIASVEKEGRMEGLLGVRSQPVKWPAHWLRLQREAPLPATVIAFKQTCDLIKTTFMFIGRLVGGKLPLESISGPVGIAKGAGESARSGLVYYLSFLALVSISLGVLNLLPIPMLDGGQLLFCFIELIRRRPLSDELKSISVYLGMVLLVMLMIIALSNDLSRLT